MTEAILPVIVIPAAPTHAKKQFQIAYLVEL